MTRDRIIELLRGLPADATIDDAIEELAVVARIERGIAEIDAGLGAPHDEVGHRFDELVAAGVLRLPVEQGDPFEAWPEIHLSRAAASQSSDWDREGK